MTRLCAAGFVMDMSQDNGKKKKIRVDQLLFERGLVESRQRGQALLMAGQVLVNDTPITKAGQMVFDDAEIRIKGDSNPYVSRGGLKLEGALDHYSVNPQGWVCLDVGASTGGFTDCLLQKGATKVYALDVGTNQLAWKLRSDPRVVSWEQMHINRLTPEHISEKLDLIVTDVSFISLTLVIPYLLPFMQQGARLLAMVKPQFEVGKGEVGKGGVVRDEAQQLEAVAKVETFLRERGFIPEAVCPAPIQGPKGNQEYFLYVNR